MIKLVNKSYLGKYGKQTVSKTPGQLGRLVSGTNRSNAVTIRKGRR